MRLTTLLLALALLAPVAHSDGIDVRVLSWNIDRARTGKSTTDLSGVAKVLRAAKADLIALQGCTADQRSALAAALSWPHHVFAIAPGRGDGLAWLGRWPMGERLVLPLPKGKGGREAVGLAATVTLPRSGTLAAQRVILVNLQLDPDRSKAFAQAIALDTRFRPIKTPTLLAGDLSHPREASPLKALAERFELPTRTEQDKATAHLGWRDKTRFSLVSYQLLVAEGFTYPPALLTLRRK